MVKPQNSQAYKDSSSEGRIFYPGLWIAPKVRGINCSLAPPMPQMGADRHFQCFHIWTTCASRWSLCESWKTVNGRDFVDLSITSSLPIDNHMYWSPFSLLHDLVNIYIPPPGLIYSRHILSLNTHSPWNLKKKRVSSKKQIGCNYSFIWSPGMYLCADLVLQISVFPNASFSNLRNNKEEKKSSLEL